MRKRRGTVSECNDGTSSTPTFPSGCYWPVGKYTSIRSCRHVAPDIEDSSGYSMGYRCLSNKKNRRTTVWRVLECFLADDRLWIGFLNFHPSPSPSFFSYCKKAGETGEWSAIIFFRRNKKNNGPTTFKREEWKMENVLFEILKRRSWNRMREGRNRLIISDWKLYVLTRFL